MSDSKRIVVIGASAGGVEALKQVVRELPEDFPAAICVVLHIPPYQPSSLPQILTNWGSIKATHAEDGAAIKPGHIYVASPDHHLLVEDGRVAVTRGPKENRFRPSIDALFRSAAYSYGAGAIGVILSGALDDGTSGLWSVKRMGGVAIIQHPEDAQFDSMPTSALEYVAPDYNIPASEICALLVRLLAEERAPQMSVDEEVKTRMQKEVAIAKEGNAFKKGFMQLGDLTPYTCPECSGALIRVVEGSKARFRCHTGHAYTDNALLQSVTRATGEQLWKIMRSLEEGVMLLREMADNLGKSGDKERGALFREQAEAMEKRSRLFHQDVLKHENLSGDNLGVSPSGELMR